MDVRVNGSPLQLGEDGFSTRDGNVGAGFKLHSGLAMEYQGNLNIYLNVFDNKVVKDQSIAAGTYTKTDSRQIH